MALSTRDIKRRITSVANTKKITKAMELVAASKMRKAVERVLYSRAYSDLAWSTVLQLVRKVDQHDHPLLTERPVKKVAVMVIGSNRGLCGGFNMQVMSKIKDLIKKEGWDKPGIEVDVITSGRQVLRGLTSMKFNVAADYKKDDITDEVADILPIARHLTVAFTNQEYDEVAVAYTHFHSSLRQEARIRHLLPLVKPSRVLATLSKNLDEKSQELAVNFSEYLFEPSTDAVLESLLPRLIEVQIYQMFLESEASEHSARMMAMRNASDAAEEMISDLTLAFNQVRQAGITAEIAEIAAGAEGVS